MVKFHASLTQHVMHVRS